MSAAQTATGDRRQRRYVPHFAIQGTSPGRAATAQDRLRLWQTYGEDLRQTIDTLVSRLAPAASRQSDLRYETLSRLTDLAALHLYLTQEWPGVDAAMQNRATDATQALVRCVKAGLLRLPAYRGAAVARPRGLGDAVDRYRSDPLVVDQGFWAVSTEIEAFRGHGGAVRVWSLTGRQTQLVDPDRNRLVFLPGTRFKVLKVTHGSSPVVLMRELFPGEPAVPDLKGTAGANVKWLDDTTIAELERVQATAVLGPLERAPGVVPQECIDMVRSV
ncbi:hypothetical protein ACFQMH_37620 [Streptomyces viridiviolaceus]|uniref:NAD(+)--protein-arginine ADP-ribosyltransferase n=1 Tax=Streptomyces viridiviolaceus TaxID=68282 RepID=A0ABW2EB24_9ACTN|nr:hypothetical protein [Streptomyces viridiviolaceus]